MATKRKLKADGVTGKVAVYVVDDLAIDDSPFTAPLSHVDRVEFHSDLDYLAISSIQTGTLSLPAVLRGGPTNIRSVKHNIFAHGLGYQPLVLGQLVGFGGFDVSLLGTTIIYGITDILTAHTGTLGTFRSVQLGADATNVYLHEYSLIGPTGATMDFPAVDLDWRVMVTTRNMDSSTGNNNTVSHPSNIYISPARVVFGQGKFDTDNRHIKKSSTGFPVVIDKSIDLYRSSGTTNRVIMYTNVDGYVRGNLAAPTYTATFMKMDAI